MWHGCSSFVPNEADKTTRKDGTPAWGAVSWEVSAHTSCAATTGARFTHRWANFSQASTLLEARTPIATILDVPGHGKTSKSRFLDELAETVHRWGEHWRHAGYDHSVRMLEAGGERWQLEFYKDRLRRGYELSSGIGRLVVIPHDLTGTCELEYRTDGELPEDLLAAVKQEVTETVTISWLIDAKRRLTSAEEGREPLEPREETRLRVAIAIVQQQREVPVDLEEILDLLVGDNEADSK